MSTLLINRGLHQTAPSVLKLDFITAKPEFFFWVSFFVILHLAFDFRPHTKFHEDYYTQTCLKHKIKVVFQFNLDACIYAFARNWWWKWHRNFGEKIDFPYSFIASTKQWNWSESELSVPGNGFIIYSEKGDMFRNENVSWS